MRRTVLSAGAALSLCLSGGAMLGGCGGSQTKTVVQANVPTTASSPESTATQTATTNSQTTTVAPAQTSTAGGTAAPTTTRSAPEPAFAEGAGSAEGASAAAATLRAHGFTPNNTSEYHPNQALRVLVGTRTGSADGYGQQAFFFVNGRYIGTDAKESSASVRVVSQSDTEVTLAYPLYRKNDPLCCPGGGTATVRFQLNNGRLTALGTIPPASRGSTPSRY